MLRFLKGIRLHSEIVPVCKVEMDCERGRDKADFEITFNAHYLQYAAFSTML